jgi:hypothetical protein
LSAWNPAKILVFVKEASPALVPAGWFTDHVMFMQTGRSPWEEAGTGTLEEQTFAWTQATPKRRMVELHLLSRLLALHIEPM